MYGWIITGVCDDGFRVHQAHAAVPHYCSLYGWIVTGVCDDGFPVHHAHAAEDLLLPPGQPRRVPGHRVRVQTVLPAAPQPVHAAGRPHSNSSPQIQAILLLGR